MPGRIVRSMIADKVAELLGSREGRDHLSDYGWVQGMPIIISTAKERLSDVMGLASVHGRSVLVAMMGEADGEVHYMHVSIPNPALAVVEAEPSDTTVQSFFERVDRHGLVAFRVKYWNHSAAAHRIPVFSTGQSGRGDSAGAYLGS